MTSINFALAHAHLDLPVRSTEVLKLSEYNGNIHLKVRYRSVIMNPLSHPLYNVKVTAKKTCSPFLKSSATHAMIRRLPKHVIEIVPRRATNLSGTTIYGRRWHVVMASLTDLRPWTTGSSRGNVGDAFCAITGPYSTTCMTSTMICASSWQNPNVAVGFERSRIEYGEYL